MANTLSIPPSLSQRLILGRLERLESGRLQVSFPNQSSAHIGKDFESPVARLVIHRPLALLRHLALKGANGLAESYFAGDWDSPDLFSLMTLLAENETALGGDQSGPGQWIDTLRHRLNANSRRQAKRNIEAHYDLGNTFYALWLDETWSYSAARFGRSDESLADAQRRKYQMHLDNLGVQPDQTVLEIGCGWGGFALEAAHRGIRVHGVTLSPSQLGLAKERLKMDCLSELVKLELCDYRDIEGQYDHIVSIEMFEAVGEAYWPQFFRTLKRLLRPGGRISLQTITIDDDLFPIYRRQADFIQRHIFPGGMLPSVSVFQSLASEAGLEILDRHAFGKDYARTLEHWRRRFQASRKEITALGFDTRFLRLWDFYLAYCYAGFMSAKVDVNTFVMGHP